MSKKVLMPLAQGFEEIEFVSSADILRRAGLEVSVVSLNEDLLVFGAHSIGIKAERSLQGLSGADFDAIVLAGGYNGMLNLKADERILALIRELYSQGKLVAAICASPIVLNAAGIFDESTNFACYPGCEEGLKGVYAKLALCECENIITSAGTATAVPFALAIVKRLCGIEICEKLKKELLCELSFKI